MTKRRLAAVGIVILAMAVAIVLLLRRNRAPEGIVASGTVEATEADLGFQITGRIEALAPQEGDAVSRGEELGRLDVAELLARRDAARAQVGEARARLAELEAGSRPQEIARGRASAAAAQQRLEEARRELDRTRALYEGGAVSREELDRDRTDYEVRSAELEQARAQLDLLRAGSREEQIAAGRATLEQSQAAVAQIEAQLVNAVLRAPFSGVVSVRHREPGETVPAGAPVLTILDPRDRWVRIYVREDQIGAVKLGQRAAITSDTYPDRTYEGRVIFIASQAEFTPSNVQTPEERARLVYEVKVRITGDPRQDLKSGLPADVRLVPGGETPSGR